jgi:hypothetical protein
MPYFEDESKKGKEGMSLTDAGSLRRRRISRRSLKILVPARHRCRRGGQAGKWVNCTGPDIR